MQAGVVSWTSPTLRLKTNASQTHLQCSVICRCRLGSFRVLLLHQSVSLFSFCFTALEDFGNSLLLHLSFASVIRTDLHLKTCTLQQQLHFFFFFFASAFTGNTLSTTKLLFILQIKTYSVCSCKSLLVATTQSTFPAAAVCRFRNGRQFCGFRVDFVVAKLPSVFRAIAAQMKLSPQSVHLQLQMCTSQQRHLWLLLF